MRHIKTILLIIAAITFFHFTGCSNDNRKSRVERAVREYVEPSLAPGQKLTFIGLYNPHDTIFMGTERAYSGVIYKVTDPSAGTSERICADVILTTDHRLVITLTESDFDPIALAHKELKKRLRKL